MKKYIITEEQLENIILGFNMDISSIPGEEYCFIKPRSSSRFLLEEYKEEQVQIPEGGGIRFETKPKHHTEFNATINVDQTQLDEVIEKIRKINEKKSSHTESYQLKRIADFIENYNNDRFTYDWDECIVYHREATQEEIEDALRTLSQKTQCTWSSLPK